MLLSLYDTFSHSCYYLDPHFSHKYDINIKLHFSRIVEKDLYLRESYKSELESRLDKTLQCISLPIAFLHGKLLGVRFILIKT